MKKTALVTLFALAALPALFSQVTFSVLFADKCGTPLGAGEEAELSITDPQPMKTRVKIVEGKASIVLPIPTAAYFKAVIFLKVYISAASKMPLFFSPPADPEKKGVQTNPPPAVNELKFTFVRDPAQKPVAVWYLGGDGRIADREDAVKPVSMELIAKGTQPAVTPAGGGFSVAQTVTITSKIPDCKIRYTLDGTIPSPTNGLEYTEPFVLDKSARLMAVAYQDGWTPSPITTVVFRFTAP